MPELGVIATALGTLFCITLIPDDPEPKGALFFPALMMALGIASAPLVAGIRSFKSLFRAEHVVVLAPIYWLLLDLLQGTNSLDGIEREYVVTAFMGIGVFVSTVWIGASGRAWKFPRSLMRTVSQDVSPNTYFRLSIAAFVVGMLPFAIATDFDLSAMVYYLGENRWAAPWGRGQLGGWDAFLDQMHYFGYLLPMLTVIVAYHAGWKKGRTLLCSAMSIIVIIFIMQSGSRRIMGVIFGMALVTWVLIQRQIRTKHVLAGAAAAAALLFTLEVMLDYRTSGLASLIESEENEPLLKPGHVRVDDNFYRFCQIIALIPSSHPHVYHKFFLWVLVRPIPRVFWDGKPVDPGFNLATALHLRGVTLTSSVLGELYMAGGLIAIALGGWFYGRVAGMASQLLMQRTSFEALVIYAILTMSLFAGFRSMMELVLMNYATIAWLTILKLHQITLSNSSS